MKLREYREKRDATATNEPFGTEPRERPGETLGGAYVVHLHDARRRHYDFRFEVGGVLASFAVPKGPSLDPSKKHLAVRTEDHPIEYLDFEAVIPEGNYGAGPMILWDRGRMRLLDGPAEAGLEKGKLDFELTGMKLRGRFALVRLKPSKSAPARAKGDEEGGLGEWLFFKKKDPYASTTRDVLLEKPRSVLSGLTVEELGEAPRLARALEERAAAAGAPERSFDARTMVPMLCSTNGVPEHDPAWLYELKLDGVRVVAQKDERGVRLGNRRLRDESARYPEVVRALSALAAPRVVLDGEIVAFDEAGAPSFQRLGHRMHLTRARDVRQAVVDVPVLYVVFDLLAIGGRDLRELPLSARKELLAALLPAPGVVRALDHLEGDGRPLYAFCKERGLEGVVAKRAASPYRPGPARTGEWMKWKCERDEELVIVGFTRGEGGRGRLGALDLATFVGGELVYRGKVGSGLDERTIEALRERLEPLRVDAPSVRGKLAPAPRGRSFVRPEVVVSVRFLGWSDDGQLRHPVFRGVRDDVDPKGCTAAPPAERLAQAAGGPLDDEAPALAAEAPLAALDEPHVVAITNRDKVLFPGDGATKADLAAYYEAIAPVMLPYLRDRPVVLVRYPDGVDGKSFYQWAAPAGTPPWLRTFALRKEDEGRVVDTFLVDDAAGLVYLANLAAIPIHVLACRAPSIDACDFLTLDFDVKTGSLEKGITLARELRALLGAIGLQGFPKTSGQSGLHVLVPLGPGASFATARTLADLLGRLLCERHPESGTMERIIARRGDRVYVDTGQTGPTRTIVAPYSVRARRGATVSTPLAWDEVAPGLDPATFTIRTVGERVAKVGDPMAGMLAERPDLAAAVGRLGKLVR
jgi:bifunctional non-homologous end joining protein LigD